MEKQHERTCSIQLLYISAKKAWLWLYSYWNHGKSRDLSLQKPWRCIRNIMAPSYNAIEELHHFQSSLSQKTIPVVSKLCVLDLSFVAVSNNVSPITCSNWCTLVLFVLACMWWNTVHSCFHSLPYVGFAIMANREWLSLLWLEAGTWTYRHIMPESEERRKGNCFSRKSELSDIRGSRYDQSICATLTF